MVNTKFYRELIIESINTDGYGVSANTTKEKLQFLKNTFMGEYGWEISRVGEQKALQDWLQGLPTAISIPFYNFDILELAKKAGDLPAKPTEKQEDKIIDNYWRFMSMQILKLWRAYKIK